MAFLEVGQPDFATWLVRSALSFPLPFISVLQTKKTAQQGGFLLSNQAVRFRRNGSLCEFQYRQTRHGLRYGFAFNKAIIPRTTPASHQTAGNFRSGVTSFEKLYQRYRRDEVAALVPLQLSPICDTQKRHGLLPTKLVNPCGSRLLAGVTAFEKLYLGNRRDENVTFFLTQKLCKPCRYWVLAFLSSLKLLYRLFVMIQPRRRVVASGVSRRSFPPALDANLTHCKWFEMLRTARECRLALFRFFGMFPVAVQPVGKPPKRAQATPTIWGNFPRAGSALGGFFGFDFGGAI